MKMQLSAKFLIKTAGMAIATASLLVSLPSLAGDMTTPTITKPVTTKPVTIKPVTTKQTTKAVTKDNIVQVAVTNGNFKTLVAAVKAAGLVDTLSGKGPFTVFAPTDAAFAKLPKGTVETLLKPANKAILVKLLTYHVVPSAVLAKDIKDGSVLVKTVDGGFIKVTKNSKNVIIDNSKVVAADVQASNGVIHVIDTVLLPPDLF